MVDNIFNVMIFSEHENTKIVGPIQYLSAPKGVEHN
jgi:hypothetical protein